MKVDGVNEIGGRWMGVDRGGWGWMGVDGSEWGWMKRFIGSGGKLSWNDCIGR